ncbi:MAG TPA: hypothetical protein VNZ52_09840 [Candidatus Thermoplasmatota archaeon]|nr:hypothetical protein [Candidatus Thermoplasmatota archaeon]
MAPRVLPFLLLGILLVTDVGGALLAVGEDDAGSGGDAPHLDGTGLHIEAGSYDGRISGPGDPGDAFRVKAVLGEVFRLQAAIPAGLSMRVLDTAGVLRACQDQAGEHLFSQVTEASGAWTVRFDRNACGGVRGKLPTLPSPQPETMLYAFTVSLQQHEHVLRIDGGEGFARTLNASFPQGRFARLEIHYDFHGEAVGPMFAGIAIRVAREGKPAESMSGAVAFRPTGGIGAPRLWVQGGIPTEVKLTGQSLLLPRDPAVALIEGDGTAFDIDFGVAHSAGFRWHAWAVWDGPAFEVRVPDGDSARFSALSDFKAEGTGLQAGPYVKASRLTLSDQVPEGHTLAYVDASWPWLDPSLPSLTLANTSFVVAPPAGSPFPLRDDSWFGGSRAGAPALGTWRVEAIDVDGMWSDTLCYVRVTFAMRAP